MPNGPSGPFTAWVALPLPTSRTSVTSASQFPQLSHPEPEEHQGVTPGGQQEVVGTAARGVGLPGPSMKDSNALQAQKLSLIFFPKFKSTSEILNCKSQSY